jgi:hypothetical protein
MGEHYKTSEQVMIFFKKQEPINIDNKSTNRCTELYEARKFLHSEGTADWQATGKTFATVIW